MLTLKMCKGSRDGLQDPSSALLTASLAKALFGDTDPVNQVIRLDDTMDIRVAGVYEDLPGNTTFGYVKFLLPWDKFVSTHSWVKDSRNQWGYHFGRLIVELNDQVDFDKTTDKIRDIPQKQEKAGKEQIFLHPMDKWHLYNEFRDGKVIGGRIRFVWLFGVIGLFVLLLACINFMNLSTARSEQRAREVGIRKAIGSLRGQLIGQFLSESMVMSFLALILALILVPVSLPFFNTLLANKQLTLPWNHSLFWLFIIGFTAFTGLVAGSYPAFYLSGFTPVKTLKGAFRAGRFASLPRKALVTLQFTVSIALIIGTLIVFRQIQFAKGRPTGYIREGLVLINTTYAPGVADHFEALANTLRLTGAVENIASSNGSPTEIWINQSGYGWKGKDPNLNPLFRTVGITYDFGKTLGWKIAEGRDFSREFSSDTNAMILNETAAKLIGLKDPVGEIITLRQYRSRVIGIVKDMVMESPYKPVEPTIFWLTGSGGYITIRTKPHMPMHEALAKITPVFKKYNPDRPFDFRFIDDEYASKFAAEERIGDLAAFFTSFAIFISCLGLFGLASFVAEQRTKEIGIRKVLGATVLNLWALLSKEFVVLVMLSCLIAAPIAYAYSSQWLQGYEYRTQVSWWVFAAAGIGALLITLLTVSVQSVKAALMNPVKSLRAE